MQNIHGTAVVLGVRGVLILGPSGSGKTSLALELLRVMQQQHRYAALIGDDQLFPRALGSRLVVRPPDSIAGMAEIHGLGPVVLPHASAAIVDLVCSLVPQQEAPRYQEPLQRVICGVALPELLLPHLRLVQSVNAILACLGAMSFAGMRQNG